MKVLRWVGRWSAAILLPYLTWMGFLQLLQLVLEGGVRTPGWATIYLISGAVIALLGILSVALIARPDGTPVHYANVLTVNVLASYILIQPVSLSVAILPRLFLSVLVATVVASIVIWIVRKRRANPAA